MSFRSLTVRHEELPWSWPLRMGTGAAALRARCIMTAWDDQGVPHQAELAPCPGVHPESLSEALAFWHQVVEPQLLDKPLLMEKWNWTEPGFGLFDQPELLMSSVETALEQLLLSWAQRQNPEAYSLPAPMTLEGSALLVIPPNGDAGWREFLDLWDAGFRIFKCKVGRQAAAQEYEFLQRLVRHGAGQLQLRLDANRGMSTDDVMFWKTRGGDLPILYWEEAAGLEPVAFDESLWDKAEPPPAQAWILKPSRLGLARSVYLLKRAAAENIPCVLSNAFDSGLSLRCSAWIYAAFCANPQPLGFGTGRFLPDDIWGSGAWAAPSVTIPRQPFARVDA
ncbi:hypothetical protein [Oligoflexus tunisiensis]|uniref:hypothetical protein n=1 Tax=Oligoflexus tunisiensis TaxID=708132 RepID=UPI00114D0D8F|nr:hypothetical protein [Oligoflexus tunisiensis]